MEYWSDENKSSLLGHYSNTPVFRLVAPKSHLIFKGENPKLIVNDITKTKIEAFRFLDVSENESQIINP